MITATWFLILATGGAPSRAQEEVRRQLLGDRFVDGSFGFSIRPFAQAKINQHKVRDELDGYQLVEFVHLTRPWVLVVALDRTNRSMRAAESVDMLRAFWAKRFDTGVETEKRAERQIAARPGAVWHGRYREISGDWSIFEAVVQIDAREFFRISFKVPRTDEDTAAAMFAIMVDSFEMVRSEVSSEILDGALQRGQELLARIPSIRLAERLDADAYMLMRRGGQDVGTAHIRECAETRNGKNGVRVSERGWMFFPNGTYHYIRNDYFVSEDLMSGMFEMRVRVVTPATEDRPITVMDHVERGIRENDKLILSYTELMGDSSLTNDVLEVTGTYVPMALQRMLPRIVPLDEPELYAFSSYSSTRKGAVLRTLRVLGPIGPTAGGSDRIAYKVEDSEGMIPPASELFLDERGFVFKVIAGGDTVLRTTPAEIERLFGRRIRQAREELTRLGLEVED
ncbi:MAG: hypothetical protein JSU68_09510 [Phycisphaerales bacterium]|nr:MAG: hypothetical protein JSU68_09510 [Phycisphaerales bacterium]